MSNKYEILPAYYYRAIYLRYEGTIYREICEAINNEFGTDFHDNSVRRWFMTGGVLHDYYIEYAEEMNKLERRETVDVIKGNAKNAAKVLYQIAINPMEKSAARVNAAKALLERALGPLPTGDKAGGVTQNILNINDIDINTIGTVDFLRLLKRMDQLKNAGPIDNQPEIKK